MYKIVNGKTKHEDDTETSVSEREKGGERKTTEIVIIRNKEIL